MLADIVLSIGLLFASNTGTITDTASIMDAVNEANIIFDQSAHKTGGHRDLIVDPSVITYTTPASNYIELAVGLLGSGLVVTDRIYIVFAADLDVCGVAVRNLAIVGDRRCWHGREVAHELIHAMGGVSSLAPHGDGLGHCTDEHDVMCYDDGHIRGQITYPCPEDEMLLDCGGDDYFNTDPPGDSWLGLHPEHNRALDARLRREHDYLWFAVVMRE